jgi:hypothetical protein
MLLNMRTMLRKRKDIFLNGLAIVLIFLILAGTLFPVFRTARLSGQMEGCYANIKEQMDALRLYSEDWDGSLPQADHWMDAISPHQPNGKHFHCPSAEGYGYTFNSDLAGRDLNQIKDSAQTPIIYDGKDLRKNAYAAALSGLAAPPRHGISTARNYVGYLNGSVKEYPLPERIKGDE